MIATDNALDLSGNQQLHGRVTSYAGVRVTGFVIGLAGMALGTIIGLTTREECSGTTTSFCHNEYPYWSQGLTLMTGSALVGAIMAYQPDRAEVRAVNAP